MNVQNFIGEKLNAIEEENLKKARGEFLKN